MSPQRITAEADSRRAMHGSGTRRPGRAPAWAAVISACLYYAFSTGFHNAVRTALEQVAQVLEVMR